MQFIRIKQAAESAGVSINTIYRWSNTDHEFPTLVKLGPNSTVIEKELFDDFIRKRVEASNAARAQRQAVRSGGPQ